MTSFTWVGEFAHSAPDYNAVGFTFEPALPSKIYPNGTDLASAGTQFTFSTPPKGLSITTVPLLEGIGEYKAQSVVFELFKAARDMPEMYPAGLDEFKALGSGWPIFFKSSELGQPKSIPLAGDEFSQSGELSYIGRSVVYFGGCGFGAGDSFDTEPSYWNDEQAHFKNCLFFQGADEYSSGEVRING